MAKGRTSYFDRQCQSKGKDFLNMKSPGEIQKDARKCIFKDMAFGNIDYEKYGSYFMDATFLEQLIVVAYDEMENHRIKYTALKDLDIKMPGDQRIVSLCSLEARLTQAFEIIHMYLSTVKASDYNIACLPDLVNQLYQFRQDIALAY